MVYQDSGFVFQLKKSEAEGELPAEFINVTQKKGRVVFSTLDLVRLSLSIRDFLALVFTAVPYHKEKTKCEDERCVGRSDVFE